MRFLILHRGKRDMNRAKKVKFNIPFYVQNLLSRLSLEGESAYIVGGSVRDTLIGREPNDFDVATSATPERVCEIFSDMRVVKTGIAHGTVTVISQGKPIEITTFRVDGEYIDMRRPESVSFTRKIEDDLSRRDFTVNAMAYNDAEGLIDLFGGAEDIEKCVIRTVGDPYLRFSEDALRILRAFRFSARLGFSIDTRTLEAIEALGERLWHIARERVFTELSQILRAKGVKDALLEMKRRGVIENIGIKAPSDRAIDMFDTLENDLYIRFAAFFCDFDGATARAELSGLRSPTRLKNGVANIIDASKNSYSSRTDVARLRSQAGEHAERALRLSVALGNSPLGALEYIDDGTPYNISQLAIGGEELFLLGYAGREIGEELLRLLDKVIAEPSFNTKEGLLEIAKKDKERN